MTCKHSETFQCVCVCVCLNEGLLLTEPNELDPDVPGWSQRLCLLFIQTRL